VTAPPPSSPSPSPEPQPIVTPLRTAAIFLVLTIDPGGEDTVRDFLADVSGLQRAVGFRLPEGELAAVVGIGSDAWDQLFGGPRPTELHPFRELRGARHFAPATPGDLLFHLRANQMDLCFEFASQVMNRLGTVATVVDEVHGFRYFDERDLMGFVDGTESPGGRAGEEAALVAGADPDFTGGSYVIVQKYTHDLDSWNALSTEEQEQAIGRHKLSDIEIRLARGAEHDRRRRRQRTADPAGQHAIRLGRPPGVRHLLHRLCGHAQRDRADAGQHVHR
jgi:putative iron-dependent peroxidase